VGRKLVSAIRLWTLQSCSPNPKIKFILIVQHAAVLQFLFVLDGTHSNEVPGKFSPPILPSLFFIIVLTFRFFLPLKRFPPPPSCDK